MEKTIAEI